MRLNVIGLDFDIKLGLSEVVKLVLYKIKPRQFSMSFSASLLVIFTPMTIQ